MPPFDYSPPPYDGPSSSEIFKKRKEFLSPSMFHFYHTPVVFFTNSGTEANELAMIIARLYTGCHDIVSLRNGYHGNAAGTIGMTGQSNWNSIWYGYTYHFSVG